MQRSGMKHLGMHSKPRFFPPFHCATNDILYFLKLFKHPLNCLQNNHYAHYKLMSKLVIIRIDETSDGNLLVDLSIENENKGIVHRQRDISIPRIDKIKELYDNFKRLYSDLGEARYRERNRAIIIDPNQTNNQSHLLNCSQAGRQIEDYLKDEYFNQPAWQNLRREIEDIIDRNDLARVIIQTDNTYLKKLPWHFWDLFTRRRYAQYALSAKNSKNSNSQSHPPLKYPVKILAVFGHSEGLNTEEDKLYLKRLEKHGAEIKEIIQPRREEFTKILRSEYWDILFFAGHSRSYLEYTTGEILINDSESLAPGELRRNFTKAVERGLKLVILNSCDGLGLARQFANYGVPHIILMREPVPDEVAREFLKEFLDKLTSGKPFYLAVREACECLEGMERDNPCASWLPIIYQSPDSNPLEWPQPGLNWNYLTYEFKKFFKQLFSFLLSRKRVLLPLLFLTAIALAFLINQRKNPNPVPPTPIVIQTATPQPGKSFSNIEYLTDSSPNSHKANGLKFFNKGDFNQAAENFYQSLKNQINDPETRIYLNNAVSHSPQNIAKLSIKNQSCSVPENINNNYSNTLKIAVVIPIIEEKTGKAKEILRGVAQAQNDINCKGGIKDQLLEVTIANDKENGEEAIKVARDFVNKQDILGVVGHTSSTVILKAGDIYNNKLVAISPTSTAIRNSANHPTSYLLNEHIFRTAVSDEVAIEKLVKYWQQQGSKKIAIAFVDDDYSKIFRDKFREKLPPLSYIYDNNKCWIKDTFSADDCLQEISTKGAKALLILPNLSNLERGIDIVRRNSERNSKLLLLAGDVMYSDKTLELKEKAENLVIPSSWIKNPSQPTPFEGKARDFWGSGNISWRTITAYDATAAMIQGLKNTNKINPKREDLKAEFSKKDFSAEGAIEKVMFKDGDRAMVDDKQSPTGMLGKVGYLNGSYQFLPLE
jgi:branched-chain amino acid transport system substrate-binding protein